MAHQRNRRVLRICLALALGWFINPSNADADDNPEIQLPDGTRLQQIDYQRHVLPLVTRFGCNTANCHGSFQGRGGFRLSLFGHAGPKDFEALTDRVDRENPSASLILVKPSLQEEHGGGRRFEVDSWPYQILLAWVRQGANSAKAGSGVQEVKVSPATVQFTNLLDSTALAVRAEYKDGSHATVTPLCRFESHDPAIADVTSDGAIKPLRPGATHIIVSYAGGYATVPVMIPFPGNVASRDQRTNGGYIDKMIDEQIGQLNLQTTTATDDLPFLRRVTLDTVGRLPTSEEIHQFLDSSDPQKRSAVVDRLLADTQHASLWATRLCDLTGCRLETMEGPEKIKPMRARMWHEWFRSRLIDNVPFDQIVRGVISGTSREDLSADAYLDRETALIRAAETGSTGDYAKRRSLDLFYRRLSTDGVYPREALAERTAAAFLGVRIQCARCHKHPYDRWTQGDYAAFVNIFSDVAFGSSTELSQAIFTKLDRQRSVQASGATVVSLPRVQEVYDDPQLGHRLTDPDQESAARPRPLGGAEFESAMNARTALADWLTSADNHQFARNWVNRIWAHYFDRGLVEPVDGFSATNPPTHPELLEKLADEFVQSGFDMRYVERQILTSAAYQRTSTPISALPGTDRYYACAPVRPLMAEAIVGMLDKVLRSPPHKSADMPSGGSMLDVAPDRPDDSRLAYLLQLFGRGTRESVCDCERTGEPTLRQTLHLMSDAAWIEQIQKSPLIDELLIESEDRLAVEKVMLLTLSRYPSPEETDLFLAHLGATSDRRTAWVDVLWTLMNSREFRTNH